MSMPPSPTAWSAPSTKRSQSRTYSKKRKRVDVEENKENLRGQGEDEGKFVDSAYQSMTNEEPPSPDELEKLQNTPSRKRKRAGTALGEAATRSAEKDRNREDATNQTGKEANAAMEGTTPTTRASGRQRKQTWKLSDTPVEDETPSKKRKTPTSQSRSKAKPASTLPVLVKDPAEESASIAVPAPTPTPKRRGRPPKSRATEQTSAKEASVQHVALTGDRDMPTITLQGEPSQTHIKVVPQERVILQTSQLETQTPTSTPRKRGRPPKNRNLEDQFSSPMKSDFLFTPSKRPRKTAAGEERSGDPLASLIGKEIPLTPSKKASKQQPALAAALQPVGWQEYEEAGTEAEAQLEAKPEDIKQELECLLQEARYRESIPELKARIVACLTGKQRLPLHGLDEAYGKVRSVVQQTVAAGEGNSMMIIGPRGSGKTALIDSILEEMALEHQGEFHVIRLNGFVHTDDKLALRDMWRQLGREMEVEDEGIADRSNYADTLASLLAVLSHPTERSGEQAQVAKSVVFVIDEFDQFTTHPRQTLLYNLFDIAQASRAPIAVLGLTTRVDVAESLEKRVKSRFSHRHVFLPRPKSFSAFKKICLAALTAGGGSSSRDTVPSIKVDGMATQKEDPSPDYSTLHAAWSRYATSLLHESTALTGVLRLVYATSRSVPMALSALLLPAASLSAGGNVPDSQAFATAAAALLPPDSKLALLPALADAELALLVAAARLDIILNVDTCNFNMAYDEYATLAGRARTQAGASGALALGGATAARLWSRRAALAAWERLEALELIMPLATAGYGAGAGLADVGRAGRLMRCDVSLEEIRYSGLDMGAMMARWCKEI